MVEETVYSNKPKTRAARPRPVFLWSVFDVQKWLRRHCSDYYPLYGEIFQQVNQNGCMGDPKQSQAIMHSRCALGYVFNHSSCMQFLRCLQRK